MIYATSMSDGSLALTEIVPSAVISQGRRDAVTGTMTREGRIALVTAAGIVATGSVSLGGLAADSVPGATLEFPGQAGEIAKWHPDRQAKVATLHGAIDHAVVPADRRFRGAWRHSGGSVAIDMDDARALHRDRMRVARAPLLAALDVAYQRADEAADAVAKANVAGRKQALRDVTADPAIAAAATADELAAIWPAVLGDAPAE